MEEIFGEKSGNIKIKGFLDCFEENEFLAELEKNRSIYLRRRKI